MKNRIRRPDTKSLTYVCVAQVFLVVLAAILIYLGLSVLTSRRISNAFPDISRAMNYTAGISYDEWSGFLRKYPQIQLLVFSDEGEEIFSSDEDVSALVDEEDIKFIPDESGDQYYKIVELDTPTSQGHMIYRMRKEGNREVASRYCMVDRDYRILSGNLFTSTEQLNEHQVNLLQGIFSQDRQIVRAQYTNAKGEDRTLVFIAPIMSSQAYSRLISDMRSYYILGGLVLISFVFLSTWMLRQKIRRNLDPMIEEIRNYTAGEYQEEVLPETLTEFRIIGEEIHTLMGKLDEARRRQRKEEWERRRVTASLTHDLKTPIAVIMGYTQAFRDNRIPEDQREHYYEMLCEKSQLASDMIDSMSEYTKMEHPDFNLQTEVTEIGEFMRQYLMSVYDELVDGGVDLYPEIEEVPMYARIDARMFIRVMNNLIGNARKYNPNGVRLLVKVFLEKHTIAIVVEDDGIGIEPELRDTVFHPFVTSNEARTSGKGTGLGLAIVNKIVERHGGTITLTDAEDEGYHTEFRILLPEER